MQYAFPPPMDFCFDRGTILIDALDVWDPEASRLPGCFLWDPRVDRFRAPGFRLALFLEWLREQAIPYTYRTARPEGFRPDPVPPERLPELRPYQEEALRAWMDSGCRGLLALPTGSGKTRLAIRAILSLGEPALVLVPTRPLLQQWREALSRFYPGEIGLYGDGEHLLRPITLATYESGRLNVDRYGDHFDILVVDEAHHLASEELSETAQMATAPHRLGLSAAYSDDPGWLGKIEPFFGPIQYELPMTALAGKHLAPFEVKVVPLRLAPEEQAEYDRHRMKFSAQFQPFRQASPSASWGEFVRAAVRSPDGREALAALRQSQEIVSLARAKILALDLLLDLHRDAARLIFTANNRSAYEISRRFLVPAITCDIGRPEREDILRGFKEGRTRALVSSKVLNEGLDVPEASVAIIVGGGSSPLEHLQRIGRVLRPQEGKKAIIYELVVAGTGEWRVSEWRARSRVFCAASPL